MKAAHLLATAVVLQVRGSLLGQASEQSRGMTTPPTSPILQGLFLHAAAAQCAGAFSAALVPAGCPCYPEKGSLVGRCAAGFVCAEPWTEQQGAAGAFTCVTCQYGQWCPQGSTLPPASSPAIQL